jgi:hypothetical protein
MRPALHIGLAVFYGGDKKINFDYSNSTDFSLSCKIALYDKIIFGS